MKFFQTILWFTLLGVSFALFDKTPKLNTEDCVCRLRIYDRIVNGQIAEMHQVPWIVSLADEDGDHFCGGVIVNSKYVLTAAHCMTHRSAKDVKVCVSLHELEDADLESKTYHVRKIKSMELVNAFYPGDISLLKLKTPIKFMSGRFDLNNLVKFFLGKVEPACLNLVEKSYTGLTLMAAGWGATTPTLEDKKTGESIEDDVSPILKYANFFEKDGDCMKFLICIDSDNKDSICQGDSGGPLHLTQNGRTSVEGVASFVDGEENEDQIIHCTGSSAYSRLSYYKKWLENELGTNYCSL